MRIEFRSSAGHKCQNCGATQLMSVASTGEAIEVDLWETLKPYLEEFQYVVCSKGSADYGDILELAPESLASERQLDDLIDEIFRRHAPRFRLYRRRWLKRVKDDMEVVVQELRKQTSSI